MSPRRKPGAGSVDPVKHTGKWRARINLADGSRKTLGAQYATREDAERELDAALHLLAQNELAPVGGVTCSAWFWKRWIPRRELEGSRSIRDQKNMWKLHIDTSPIAHLPIAAVTSRHLRELRDSLFRKRTKHRHLGTRTQTPLSRSRITNILNLLRAFFRDAVEAEIVTASPAKDVRLPRAKGKTTEAWAYLTPEEQVAFLRAHPFEQRCLVGFAMGTGMREGEIRALKIADIFLDVPHPEVIVRFGKPGKPTKSGKIRRVPLFGMALEAVRAWAAMLPAFAPVNPRGLFFPRASGATRSGGHIFHRDPQAWKDALTAAGIRRNVRFHDLRHTCGASLVSGWWGRKWSLDEVRDMLGHSSVTVTERYAHLGDTALKLAARDTSGGMGGDQVPPLSKKSTKGPKTKVTVGAQAMQLFDIGQEGIEFLNRWPAVRLCPGAPAENKAVGESETNLRDLAVTLLEAIASQAPEAADYAARLAELVMADEAVELCEAIRRRDGWYMQRARRLAELVLERTEGSVIASRWRTKSKRGGAR